MKSSFFLPEVPCWRHHGEGSHRRSPKQVRFSKIQQMKCKLQKYVFMSTIDFVCRENNSEPWGFRLSGGKDQGQPLQISQVAL